MVFFTSCTNILSVSTSACGRFPFRFKLHSPTLLQSQSASSKSIMNNYKFSF